MAVPVLISSGQTSTWGSSLLTLLFSFFAILLAVGIFLFWLKTLIDAITRKTSREFDSTMKVVWVLAIIFLGLLGSALYCLLAKPKLESELWTWAKSLSLMGLVGFIVVFIIMLVTTMIFPSAPFLSGG